MTFGTTLALIVIMLLAVNIIVILAYLAPIFGEVRTTLRHVNSVMATVDERVRKVDHALDGVTDALGTIKSIKTITDPIARLLRRRERHKRTNTEDVP